MFPCGVLFACALLWSACGHEVPDSAVEGPSSSDAIGSIVPSTPDGSVGAAFDAWQVSPARHVTLATFEGRVDPAAGAWEVSLVEPQTHAGGAFQTANQALWCGLSSGSGGDISFFSADEPVVMLPGDPLAPECTGAGVNDAPFTVLGARCGTVRLESNLDETLYNVHAEIFEFTGSDQQIGFRAPQGSGAEIPNEDYPLSQQFGLWSYGDVAPGAAVDVLWTFRNNDPTDAEFRFTGRVVHEVRECDEDRGPNGIDDDCDGVIDNGCGIFPGGEACVIDEDCLSGECAWVLDDPSCEGPDCEGARRCTGACEAGIFGAACDQTCPGGVDAPCSGNGTCDDGVDGSGLCDCAPGYMGSACEATCDGGPFCHGNGVCDTSGAEPLCVCDPLEEAHGPACQFTCNDGEENGDEEGVDCGGPCSASCTIEPPFALSAGVAHTCAIRSDRVLICWGATNYPALGGRFPEAKLSANGDGAVVEIPGNWTSVSAGATHTCARLFNGVAYCWGDGAGALGAHIPGATVLDPQVVQLPGNWHDVSAGTEYSCGVRVISRDGFCWGSSADFKLGAETGTYVQVPGQWMNITAGFDHSCGVMTDESVRCWGRNTHAQTNGLGATTPIGPVAPTPTTGKQFIRVAVGGLYTCGYVRNGNILCWGSNQISQIVAPGPPYLTNDGYTYTGVWLAVETGYEFTCRLASSRRLYCNGRNAFGQVRLPISSSASAEIPGTWSMVSTGHAHTCAVSTDGLTSCWGRNNTHQATVPTQLWDF